MTEDWINQVHEGDARELLQQMDSNSVDLVATDPPYNISEDAEDIEGEWNTITQDFGDWDKGGVLPSQWVSDCERVLKPERAMISFYDSLEMGPMRKAMEEAGFEFFSKYYWRKSNPPPKVRVGTWMTDTEEMWFAVRGGGGSHWTNDHLTQRPATVTTPIPLDKQYTDHPTQKPVKVFRELIRHYCPPDGVVLDPFVGSGTAAVAASLEGRDWIAFERDEEWAETARRRVREEGYALGQDSMEVEW